MNRSFNEHIKEQFGSYQPEVPPHIWENIMAGKQTRKPLGFFIMKIAAGLIILGGLSAGIFYYLHQKNNLNTFEKNTLVKDNPSPETKHGNSQLPGEPTVLVPADRDSNTANSTGNNPNASDKNSNQLNNQTIKNGDRLKRSSGGAFTVKTILQSPVADDISNDDKDVITDEMNNIALNESIVHYDYQFSKMQFQKITQPAWLKNIPIPCPTAEQDAAGNKRYFEFYGGPDYAMRSFSDTSNSAYLQTRKTSTKVVAAFSAGIRYTRVFNNGMSVRTGLNYSQINEKLTYRQGNIVQLTYNIDTNGDTTGTFYQTVTHYKSVINKYRSIDVPLVIGYELGNGRLHANINAGAMVNVYSWQRGSMIDTSNNIVDISTGKGGPSAYQFKTNMGVSLTGAASVYYKLNDHLHLLAEPYYRYSLSQANNNTLTLKQKYNTAGLRLGLRLDF